jgi:Na+/H+ antiporter NhaC
MEHALTQLPYALIAATAAAIAYIGYAFIVF